VVKNLIEAMSQVGKALPGSRILVLGMAYNRYTDDLRELPLLTFIELLKKRDAEAACDDPFFASVDQDRKYA
jgi:UDP-N-acetyl-D-glucosamine dehydrogenase